MISLILIVLVLLLSNTVLVDCIYLLFLVQFVYFIFAFKYCVRKVSFIHIFSPCSLTLIYFCINFIFGSYFIHRNIGFESELISDINKLDVDYIRFIVSFFLFCNELLFIIMLKTALRNSDMLNLKPAKRNIDKRQFFLISALLLILYYINIDLGFLGVVTSETAQMTGSNSNFPFRFILAILLFYGIANQKLHIKLLIYILVLVYFIATSFDSKREIMYVFISILFLESIYGFLNRCIKVTFKNVFLLLSFVLLFFTIITSSSILRGSGEFKVDGVFSTFKYFPDYISSDAYLNRLTSNFEFNSVYGNSLNGTAYFLEDKINYKLGETFFKIFFLPIPRSIMPDKPKNMIDYYTDRFNLDYETSSCYPIIIYTEVFGNFHLLGLLLLILIFVVFEEMYFLTVLNLKRGKLNIYLLINVFLLSSYIGFVRGSGISSYFVNIIIVIPLLLLVKYILKLNNKITLL